MQHSYSQTAAPTTTARGYINTRKINATRQHEAVGRWLRFKHDGREEASAEDVCDRAGGCRLSSDALVSEAASGRQLIAHANSSNTSSTGWRHQALHGFLHAASTRTVGVQVSISKSVWFGKSVSSAGGRP